MAEPGFGDGLAVSGRHSPADAGRLLTDLVYNLRWSWDERTTALFEALAPDIWHQAGNPVPVLREVEAHPERLGQHLSEIQAIHQDLETYLSRPTQVPGAPRVAYFSAEFAIANCLAIYSGGLGVLAGDHLKSASDLGLPLVAVGLLYRYGYFRQVIDERGWQREYYDHVEPDQLPLYPCLRSDGSPVVVGVPFPGRTVQLRVWRAQVGRVPLYLLDSELPENRPDDRWITGHLYGGDQDTRIRQEIVLGIGGVRALREVLPESAPPHVFHMNEGHAAFCVLELAREQLDADMAMSFDEAMTRNAPCLAFTTHTPVEAGHDAFPSDLIEAYFAGYRDSIGLSHEKLMEIGRRDLKDTAERFSMTILALRGAAYRNGVSQLHGVVSEQMWGGIGVGMTSQPPVVEMAAITNGVHVGTWIGPSMARLYDETIGGEWRVRPDIPGNWDALAQADPGRVWTARTAQRAHLIERVDALARAEGLGPLAEEIVAERAMVIGFARRFATYKRAGLLLTDPERLERLLKGEAGDCPVLIVFAGKAHPRDDPGKALVQRVVQAARDPRFRGRLVFLENYNVDIAAALVQGSDIWLNTPRRPLEASGTSGMKATLNGALHLSELDGWWDEAYRPELGWALGEGLDETLTGEARDQAEANQLLDMLEREVTPLFFDRAAAHDVPYGWVERLNRSIRVLAPAFSAQRMVHEYATRVYIPAGEQARPGVAVPVRRY